MNCPHCGSPKSTKKSLVLRFECDYAPLMPHTRGKKCLQGELKIMTTCRDHWKTSFEHERENVIRLRELLKIQHGEDCQCRDCSLC